MKAYHFVGKTLRDGSPVPPNGVKLVLDRKPILCERGFHASIDPYDALKHAPGATLCVVECSGTIIQSDDKLVCTERTILRRYDAIEMLRYFARWCALSAVHLYPNDDPVVLDFLMTGENAARAAERAAVGATHSAADVARAADAAEYAAAYAADAAARAADAEYAAYAAEYAARAADAAAYAAAYAARAADAAADATYAADAEYVAYVEQREFFNQLVSELI